MNITLPGFVGITVYQDQDCFIFSVGMRRNVAYALYALAAFGLAAWFLR